MKALSLRFAVLIPLWVAPCAVFAQEDTDAAPESHGAYYLELGSDVDNAAAEQQWNQLLRTNKRALGALTFYPRTIIEDGKATGVRIQAGPVDSKAKADRICARLFRKNVPCFVIEGLEGPPVGTVKSLKETIASTQQVSLPWSGKSKPSSADSSGSSDGIDLWGMLFGDSKDEDKSAADKDSKVEFAKETRKGRVEVAEAIAVPVSGDDKVQPPASVQVKALPERNESILPKNVGDSKAFWLNVYAFPDEKSASAFWQNVRKAVPRDAAGLRVRIVQPFLSKGKQTAISLNIGPFGSSEDADAFCTKGVEAVDPYMRCSIGDSDKPEKSAESSEKRKKTYWVQIISAESQIDAMAVWERVKGENEDILEGKRSSVAASTKDVGRYAVRVGPMDTNEEASSLCDALNARGVECDVMRTGGK